MAPFRMTKKVRPAGTLHLEELPYQEGQMVEVIVRPIEDDMSDLAQASESALDFWDNEMDDRVWNDTVSSA